MLEIIKASEIWVEVKETLDLIEMLIPLFGAYALFATIKDLPGTIRMISKVGDTISKIIEWIRAGRD